MKRIEQKEIAIDEMAEINGGIFQCVAMDLKKHNKSCSLCVFRGKPICLQVCIL